MQRCFETIITVMLFKIIVMRTVPLSTYLQKIGMDFLQEHFIVEDTIKSLYKYSRVFDKVVEVTEDLIHMVDEQFLVNEAHYTRPFIDIRSRAKTQAQRVLEILTLNDRKLD